MPRFVVIEIQHVKVVREVEASTREEAYDRFCDGEGAPTGQDGAVGHSELLSITLVHD